MLIGVVSKLCLSRRSVIRRKGISIHWKVTNAWSLLALPVDRQPFMPFMENEVWIDNTATPLALTEKAVYICDSKWLIIAPFITSLNKMTEWRSNLRLILCSVFKCWIHFKTRQNSKFLLFNYLFVGFHQQHSHLRNILIIEQLSSMHLIKSLKLTLSFPVQWKKKTLPPRRPLRSVNVP